MPGQSEPVLEQLRIVLAHREVVGGILLVSMLFFSALAFTVLENAMSVIFLHRVAIRRRHFLVSAVLPYVFIVFLGVGLLAATVVSGKLAVLATRDVAVLGTAHSLESLSNYLLYLMGVAGEVLVVTAIYLVMPVGRISWRHALIGGITACRAVGDHAPRPRLVLRHAVADPGRLRFVRGGDHGTAERGDRRDLPARSARR